MQQDMLGAHTGGGQAAAMRQRPATRLLSTASRTDAAPARAGRHVVVCTSTASGKSLCYALPIIEALVQDPAACALLMFPTKALAQDQLRALRELMCAALGPSAPAVDVYDGDTPQVAHSPPWLLEQHHCQSACSS